MISKRNFIKNFIYTFGANLASMLLSAMFILILPKFIDKINFGYWQLYLLYVLFIGYNTFGITDGAYIKYGGKEYTKLDVDDKISFNLFSITALNLVTNAIFIFVFFLFSSNEGDKFIIFSFSAIVGVLYMPRLLITSIFQSTNKIKEYALIVVLEKFLLFTLVIVSLFFGVENYIYFIIFDVVSRIVVLLYSLYSVRRYLVRFSFKRVNFRDLFENMNIGIKIVIANLSSMLINGIVRYIIEIRWGIEEFANVSLSFSFSNMFMILIISVSIVFFPMLNRLDKDKYSNTYKNIRFLLSVPLFALLLFVFPLIYIIGIWLPSYSLSLKFLVLLFPMYVFESKTKLLINNYLKVLRKERYLMTNNLLSVFITFVLSYITSYYLNDINLTVLVILIVIVIKYILAERYLSNIIGLKLNIDIIIEVIMTISFVLIFWFLNNIFGFLLYFIMVLAYVFIKKEELKNSIRFLRG